MLNEHLHRIGRHPNGLCSLCNQKETLTRLSTKCVTPLVKAVKENAHGWMLFIKWTTYLTIKWSYVSYWQLRKANIRHQCNSNAKRRLISLLMTSVKKLLLCTEFALALTLRISRSTVLSVGSHNLYVGCWWLLHIIGYFLPSPNVFLRLSH